VLHSNKNPYGNVTVILDPSIVNGWIVNSGTNNFGIMIRAFGGLINIISTASSTGNTATLSQGPILQVTYGDTAGIK